jgi:hypothetical protein
MVCGYTSGGDYCLEFIGTLDETVFKHNFRLININFSATPFSACKFGRVLLISCNRGMGKFGSLDGYT